MKTTFQERLDRFDREWMEERSRSLRLGWVRVGTFCLAFALYVVGDVTTGAVREWAWIGLGLALVAFFGQVVWHRRIRARERGAAAMVRVNREALARQTRSWEALPPTLMKSPSSSHPYALDLDVCGEASLFRLLTTPTLPPGRATLREWLLGPAPLEEIRSRQRAAEELAPLLDLRQRLEVTGSLVDSPAPASLDGFLSWAEEEPWLPGHRWILVGAWVLPLLSILLLFLHFSGPVNSPWWVFTMVASFTLATLHRKRIHRIMEEASGGQERFGRYAAVLELLLEMDVKAPALRELQDAVHSSPMGAARELRRLGRRVGWSDIRLNAMAHAPVQAFLAWDIHVLASLERWKRKAGPHVRRWLVALGRLEALAALAALKGDNPEWSFPLLRDEGEPGVRATGMGHPLLPPSSCIVNDFEIGPRGSFLFVTGSNMSGKSTLLRSIGINTVLARAGGPVCASEMVLTPLQVHTSMRTADSLSQGISQYMAELKRIQQVVEAAREEGVVLYLLDEPLQGTNEAERRVAVQTILGHLLDAGAVGAVATHDLYLDGTDRLGAAASAVHLEGRVGDGESGPLLEFDYRLRAGRATSTNALALLRAVGLGGTTGP
jgi:hypothetical protein